MRPPPIAGRSTARDRRAGRGRRPGSRIGARPAPGPCACGRRSHRPGWAAAAAGLQRHAFGAADDHRPAANSARLVSAIACRRQFGGGDGGPASAGGRRRGQPPAEPMSARIPRDPWPARRAPPIPSARGTSASATPTGGPTGRAAARQLDRLLALDGAQEVPDLGARLAGAHEAQPVRVRPRHRPVTISTTSPFSARSSAAGFALMRAATQRFRHRVDPVGEVHRRGAARHRDDLAFA